MHDGQRKRLLLLELTYLVVMLISSVFSKNWSLFAQQFFLCFTLKWKDTITLFLMVPKSSLSCFDLPRCCSVSGKIRNDYRSFIKNAWLFYVAREVSTQFTCVHTLCCMSDQDLFWHLWKLIVYESEAPQLNHIILYLKKSDCFVIVLFIYRYSGTFKMKRQQKTGL